MSTLYQHIQLSFMACDLCTSFQPSIFQMRMFEHESKTKVI